MLGCETKILGGTKVRLLKPLAISLFASFIVTMAHAQQSDESDLRESFDNHLQIYTINMKIKPKGYTDLESFILEKKPGQDVEHPGIDSLGRSAVGGMVKLTDGTVYPMVSAFLRINQDKKYEWLTFETAEVNGRSYKFNGRFLRRRVEDRPLSPTYLRGTLTLSGAGEKVLTHNLPFTIYADL